ncbi:MAG: N-sulfoglucosamine sulfohydrolase [Verrucomicrobiales bacterium]
MVKQAQFRAMIWKSIVTFAILASAAAGALAQAEKPNILIITVDDMSADSLGVFGCPLPTSPNVDKLAAESLRFEHAHVVVGNCYPSRNVMWSGRYPHNNGAEGFYQVRDIKYPVLCDLMKSGGYHTTIRGKVTHSTPYQPYAWDLIADTLPDGTKAHLKDVKSYGTSTTMGISAAKEAGKPFCVMVNISDPHKPFWKPNDPHPTSREFTTEEVPVPGFLFDDPEVREELVLYYNSVRRADDAVGAILKALNESGQQDNTIVLFLSDHGMPLPFAKTQLWHHSTNTPLMVKWPGVTEAGAVDEEHMVSAVDLLPTLLDTVGIEHPDGLDGRSFEPLLRGEKQEKRDYVFKVYNENSGGQRAPIRGVQTKQFLYLFNPWSDGKMVFKTATNGTASYRRMKQVAATNEAIAARLDVMDHRSVEEFYDISKDPDCITNLIDNPEYRAQVAELGSAIEKIMTDSGDHVLAPWQERADPAAIKAYVEAQQEASDERRASKRKNNPKNKKKAKAKPGKAS